MKYLNKKQITVIDSIIKQGLSEDVGTGDLTSELLITKDLSYDAELILKEVSVIAGLEIFKRVFEIVDKKISIKFYVKDGDICKKGTILAHLHGNARNLLKSERLALNILQRMSGIANKVCLFNKMLNAPDIRILDTRKTTPNFRILEKLAVRIGGGFNHRFGLYDMILIKDNHIDACGGIKNTLNILRRNLKKKISVEIEIRNFNEFLEVKEHSNGLINIIMLDNFSLKSLKKIINCNKKEFMIEISGGINSKNIKKYSEIKEADFISAGSLTHSYKSTDISLNFKKKIKL